MVINLTPHDIHLLGTDGTVLEVFQASGKVARGNEQRSFVKQVLNCRLSKVEYGNVQDLPEYQEGVYYIVSALLRASLPDRKDLWSPDEQVRDEAGRVIGCRGFVVNGG